LLGYMWIGLMLNQKNKKENDELNPYDIDKMAKIPASWKISFMKFWLAGACFLLAFYGLGVNFSFLDRVVVFGLLLILGIEYITNTIIIWMNRPESNTLKHLPHEVNRKSVLSFFATALYVLVMISSIHYFIIFWTWLGFKTMGEVVSEATADPITFGFLFLIFDYIWISVRKFIKNRKVKIKQ